MNKPMWLFSGRGVDILDLKPEDINKEDIARALAYQCRFAGHVNEFYSVAQHSVLVSYLTQSLVGLLHDASEAYIGDLTHALKYTPGMTFYRDLEQRILTTILTRFGLSPRVPANVKAADKKILKLEVDSFLFSRGLLHGWSPKVARQNFLQRFEELS